MGHRKKKIIGDLTREIKWNKPPKKIKFESFKLPIINQPFPIPYINDIISCQPMNLPAAKIYYKDFNSKAWHVRFVKWIRHWWYKIVKH